MVASLTVWVYFCVGNSTGISCMLWTRGKTAQWIRSLCFHRDVKGICMTMLTLGTFYTKKHRGPTAAVLHLNLTRRSPGSCIISQPPSEYLGLQAKVRTTDGEGKKKITSLALASVKLQFDRVLTSLDFGLAWPPWLGWGEVCPLSRWPPSPPVWEGWVLAHCALRDHSRMGKASSMRDSIDLPCTLLYFSPVPSWRAHHNLGV